MEDYLSLLSERRDQAVSLDDAIIARYGNRAKDASSWATLYLDELTNSGVNQSAPKPPEIDIMGEYAPKPLPHSPSFVYRFAKLISGDPENIAPELEEIFPDFDAVEMDYLRGLTEKLKSISVDSPNTFTVVFGEGRILTYESKTIESSAIKQMRKTHAVLLNDATCRAGFSIMKHWLKRRAKDIHEPSTKGITGENSSFSDYLLEHKSDILDYLKQNFTGAKPARITPVLYALKDLGCLSSIALNRATDLFNNLTALLGDIGTRQALDTSLKRHNDAPIKHEGKITEAKEAIKDYLGPQKISN